MPGHILARHALKRRATGLTAAATTALACAVSPVVPVGSAHGAAVNVDVATLSAAIVIPPAAAWDDMSPADQEMLNMLEGTLASSYSAGNYFYSNPDFLNNLPAFENGLDMIHNLEWPDNNLSYIYDDYIQASKAYIDPDIAAERTQFYETLLRYMEDMGYDKYTTQSPPPSPPTDPNGGNPDSGNPDSGNPDGENPDGGNPDGGNPFDPLNFDLSGSIDKSLDYLSGMPFIGPFAGAANIAWDVGKFFVDGPSVDGAKEIASDIVSYFTPTAVLFDVGKLLWNGPTVDEFGALAQDALTGFV